MNIGTKATHLLSTWFRSLRVKLLCLSMPLRNFFYLILLILIAKCYFLFNPGMLGKMT